MRLKCTILFLSLTLLAFFTSQRASAQCDLSGQVVELNCGKAILSYGTGDMLVPMNGELDGVYGGTEVVFSYENSAEPTPCTTPATIAVDITCFDVTSLPPANCDVDFTHQASFDGTPTASFEPFIIDNSIEYYWEFGDGQSSTEMLPEHEYDEQATYTVCLTMSGGDCPPEPTCKEVDLHECHAEFSYESADGVVSFYNSSTGNFTEWEWSMGDGNSFANEVVESYDYGGEDIYTVCLTVWNDNGCTNQFCDFVFTGNGDICDFTDCVLPGDTDTDLAANVYDLLPIGVGYGMEGPPRSVDVATVFNWSPQYSPDWNIETINGIDFKHLDCNGDGIIEDADMEAIEINYAAPEDIFMVTAPGEPYFWLDFDWDTVVVTDDSPPFIELEADLMAGTSTLPMANLRGFALQMDYPEDMVLEGGGVEVDYNDNSFLGNSNGMLWMGKDRYEDGEMDVAFTRKTTSGDGFGKVADVKFIVIADVIARSENEQPFTVDLNGVVAVNSEGAQLALNQPDEEATVIIINKMTTDAKSEYLAQQVSVFPNPSSGDLWVTLGDLEANQVEMFNTLGQRVRQEPTTSNQLKLDVSMLAQGVYILHVHTSEGVAKKRVVVE